MESTLENSESIAQIIKTIDEARTKKDGVEKIADWAVRFAMLIIIWYCVKVFDKVDQQAEQINTVTNQMGTITNQVEIVKHDMEYIRRDVSRLENSLDKLTDKKPGK